MIVILVPAHTIPYCKIHFSFHKNGNKSSPKCASLITQQMYSYFLATMEQKVGKLRHYMAAVARGKRRYNLQTHLSTANITQHLEARVSVN